jgi:phenylacetate-CoA ligase
MRAVDVIYAESPVWAQQAMVAGYGWWWYHRRFNVKYELALTDFRKRDKWMREDLHKYQKGLLSRLLIASSQSKYYGPLLGTHRPETFSEDPFSILANVPLLSKQTLRTRSKDLLTTKSPPRGVQVFRSSGTTGTPVEIFYTREFHALELAVSQARSLDWAGISPGVRRVMFGARKVCNVNQRRPPFWRYSPVEHLAYASVFHLSDQNLPHYLKFLAEYRPEIVMGYPSALAVIARYCLDNNCHPPPSRGIFTTSEAVTPVDRERIERAFRAKVYERYGSVEGCAFVSQCEYGKYHLSPDVGIVEILDKNGKSCKPGELGEIVCTGLHNTLQPLIRYQIGDLGRWAKNQFCECGRQMPLLEAIEGRCEDLCVTIDGRELLRFDAVFKGVQNVREAQVVQEEVSHFVINVVPSQGFNSEDVALIKQNMSFHVGNVIIDVVLLEAIPRTSNGKFKAVLCKLSGSEISRLRSNQFATRSNT